MEFINQQTPPGDHLDPLRLIHVNIWPALRHGEAIFRGWRGEHKKKRIWTRKSRVLWMHQVTLLGFLLSYLFLYVFFARHICRLLAHCCLWNSEKQTNVFGKNSLSCPMIFHFFWAARKRFSATIGARRVVCRGWRSLKPKGTADGCHRCKERSNGWPFFGGGAKSDSSVGLYIYINMNTYVG